MKLPKSAIFSIILMAISALSLSFVAILKFINTENIIYVLPWWALVFPLIVALDILDIIALITRSSFGYYYNLVLLGLIGLFYLYWNVIKKALSGELLLFILLGLVVFGLQCWLFIAFLKSRNVNKYYLQTDQPTRNKSNKFLRSAAICLSVLFCVTAGAFGWAKNAVKYGSISDPYVAIEPVSDTLEHCLVFHLNLKNMKEPQTLINLRLSPRFIEKLGLVPPEGFSVKTPAVIDTSTIDGHSVDDNISWPGLLNLVPEKEAILRIPAKNPLADTGTISFVIQLENGLTVYEVKVNRKTKK
jgi:hypothetical protein